jgi:hypothetical protein
VIADPNGGNTNLETFLAPGKFDPGVAFQWAIQGGVTWTNFCAEYGGWFNRVPALAWADNGSMYSANFNPDSAAAWSHLPLAFPMNDQSSGRASTFPTGWFPMFDLDNGSPVLVNLDSFAQNMQKKRPGGGDVPAATTVKYKITDPAFMGSLALGLGCSTGIFLILSLSPTTYSAVGSNSCSYAIAYT